MQTTPAPAAPLSATIGQASYVTPREPIAFGRFRATPGQLFWVTTPAYNRARTGSLSIARKGKSAGNAVALTLADFDRYFLPAP